MVNVFKQYDGTYPGHSPTETWNGITKVIDQNFGNGRVVATAGRFLPPVTGSMTPGGGVPNIDVAPTLIWQPLNAALQGYIVAISSNPASLPYYPWDLCPSCEFVGASNTVALDVPDGYLSPGTTYYWKVRATGTYKPGQWSAATSFTTCEFGGLGQSKVPLPTGLRAGCIGGISGLPRKDSNGH